MKTRFRKHLIPLLFFLAIAVPVAPVLVGCKTKSPQTIAYTTLATVGKTADAAYSAYLDQVVAGKVSTNSVPAVSKAYNEFQAGFAWGVAQAQNNLTNAAPAQVQALANTLISEINSAK